MKQFFLSLRRMCSPTRWIFTGGLLFACCLLFFALLTLYTAGPYSSATRSIYAEAATLERGALVCLTCAGFLGTFAQERLGRS